MQIHCLRSWSEGFHAPEKMMPTDHEIAEKIFSSLAPAEAVSLRRWLINPVALLDEYDPDGEMAMLRQAIRKVKHPSRSRELRRVRTTSEHILGNLLQAVFGEDYIIQCSKCGVFKIWIEEFFSSSSGRLRRTCKTCKAAYTKAYDRAHPESVANRANRRRALVTQAGVEPSRFEKDQLRLKQKNRCYYCGIDLGDGDAECDHRTPLTKGGTNDIENRVIACLSCNRNKHSKTEEEFMRWRRALGLRCRDD
jgi:5-methylcytosine-specific restriction endonuclease McrA